MKRTLTITAPAAKTALAAAAGLALAFGLSACGSSAGSGNAAANGSETSQAQDSAADSAQALTISDAWIKATDEQMTGAFGVVTNNTDADIQITGGSAEIAGMVELHETAADGSGGMSMRQKEGGFSVAPGESLTFQPGGDHIMLMKLKNPVAAGEAVQITLKTSAGDIPLEFTAKEFSGAQENYAPGDHGSTGAGMSDGDDSAGDSAPGHSENGNGHDAGDDGGND